MSGKRLLCPTNFSESLDYDQPPKSPPPKRRPRKLPSFKARLGNVHEPDAESTRSSSSSSSPPSPLRIVSRKRAKRVEKCKTTKKRSRNDTHALKSSSDSSPTCPTFRSLAAHFDTPSPPPSQPSWEEKAEREGAQYGVAPPAHPNVFSGSALRPVRVCRSLYRRRAPVASATRPPSPPAESSVTTPPRHSGLNHPLVNLIENSSEAKADPPPPPPSVATRTPSRSNSPSFFGFSLSHDHLSLHSPSPSLPPPPVPRVPSSPLLSRPASPFPMASATSRAHVDVIDLVSDSDADDVVITGFRPGRPQLQQTDNDAAFARRLQAEIFEEERSRHRRTLLGTLLDSVLHQPGRHDFIEFLAPRRFFQGTGRFGEGSSSTIYEDLLNLTERLGPALSHGLSAKEINQIPTFKYSREECRNDEKCIICLCDFEGGQTLRTLPCAHNFHKPCVDKWLKGNKTCPVCRENASCSLP